MLGVLCVAEAPGAGEKSSGASGKPKTRLKLGLFRDPVRDFVQPAPQINPRVASSDFCSYGRRWGCVTRRARARVFRVL